MNTKLISRAALSALGTALYTILVSIIMTNVERFLGDKPDGIFAPMAFLLLFVISAAITGSLVLGQPILLYFDNKKREGITLFIYTLLFLIIILVGIFAVLALSGSF